MIARQCAIIRNQREPTSVKISGSQCRVGSYQRGPDLHRECTIRGRPRVVYT